jgi:hypothetical protein
MQPGIFNLQTVIYTAQVKIFICVAYGCVKRTGNTRGVIYKTSFLIIIEPVDNNKSSNFQHEKKEEHIILINKEYEVAHLV